VREELLPIPEELLRKEAESVCARYRVSVEEALAALTEAFAAAPEVARRVRQRHGREDVSRWRDFREVVRRCRKSIYYGLRRYYARSGEVERLVEEFGQEAAGPAEPRRMEELRLALLGAHKSSCERLPHHAEFYERFFALAGSPATLLDVGCGMHPLSYPFTGRGSATGVYVAFDRDPRAIRAVEAYAWVVGKGRLVAVRGGLSDAGWMQGLPGPAVWDVVLMLKVVPVLSRLDGPAVARLAAVPGRSVFVTGSAQAMTRRQSIEARERTVLKAFIAQTGRRVAGEFRAGDEFGYLLA
jgi:hypothetical protein